jgi:hypothetical protein
MSIIPLHLQKRFEQRWAARFGSLVIPSALKNVGLKGSPSTFRRAPQSQRKTRRRQAGARCPSLAAALMAKAGELLANPPAIHKIAILADELPK